MSTPDRLPKANIMVAVDGSEHSLAAVKLLRDLPFPAETSITAVAVLIPRNASDHAGFEAILNHTKELLANKYVQVSTELLVGYPSEELIQFAESQRLDLVVLGAKGLRASLGILLGGVAQQVMDHALSPVLIVRAPFKGFQRVLLVTDGSPHSQKAVDYLAHFPLPDSAQVQLIHVLPPLPSSTTFAYAWPLDAELFTPTISPETEDALALQAEEEERRGQMLLEKTRQILLSRGVQASAILKRGDAATEILDFAESEHIDLIIAGSRGLSRVQSLLLGSVSRKLIQYAKCSVMIIK
jgi:nucleotide-binding universal stress UspA family protein